jgi:hypothetical protein
MLPGVERSESGRKYRNRGREMKISRFSIAVKAITVRNEWYFVAVVSRNIEHNLFIKTMSLSGRVFFNEVRGVASLLLSDAERVVSMLDAAVADVEMISGIKSSPHAVISGSMGVDHRKYMESVCGINEFIAVKAVAEAGSPENATVQSVCSMFCAFFMKAKLYAERGAAFSHFYSGDDASIDGSAAAAMYHSGTLAVLFIAQGRLVAASRCARVRLETLLSLCVRRKFISPFFPVDISGCIG